MAFDESVYRDERVLDRFSLIEGDGRTAKQLVLAPYRQFRYSAKQDDEGARVYDVANPQNVFSYGEAPEEPPEG